MVLERSESTPGTLFLTLAPLPKPPNILTNVHPIGTLRAAEGPCYTGVSVLTPWLYSLGAAQRNPIGGKAMTRDDWRYLLWFGGFQAITIAAVTSKEWVLAGVFGFFVLLFILHMSLNLLMYSPSRNEVVRLLRSIEASKENSYFMDDAAKDDYSGWDAFCDTPIIRDRFLNRIRVKCHRLRAAAISQRFSTGAPIVMSEEAIRQIGQFIREIESHD